MSVVNSRKDNPMADVIWLSSVLWVPFSTLTLLLGRQQGHLTCIKSVQIICKDSLVEPGVTVDKKACQTKSKEVSKLSSVFYNSM